MDAYKLLLWGSSFGRPSLRANVSIRRIDPSVLEQAFPACDAMMDVWAGGQAVNWLATPPCPNSAPRLPEEEHRLIASLFRWLPTGVCAAVFIVACIVGFKNYVFARPHLDSFIAAGITTEANLKPSRGRGGTPVVDLKWEAAGKSSRLSEHPISNQAFTDTEQLLASGAGRIPVLVGPTGACHAVIASEIRTEGRDQGYQLLDAAALASPSTEIGGDIFERP